MTSGEGTTSSRERELQFVAGFISLGCAVAAVLTVVVSVGPSWDLTPSRASLTGLRPTVLEPPEPLSAGEAYVVTRALPTGDLRVTQWIESDQLLFGLRIAPPQVVGTAGVAAEDLRVVADGRAVTGPERVSGPGARYAFTGASSVQISYLLTGATEHSTSAPDRALARATALDVSYEPVSERVVQTVIAAEVLSLACSPAARPSGATPCGSRTSDGEWTVELVGRHADDRVMAALTLE